MSPGRGRFSASESSPKKKRGRPKKQENKDNVKKKEQKMYSQIDADIKPEASKKKSVTVNKDERTPLVQGPTDSSAGLVNNEEGKIEEANKITKDELGIVPELAITGLTIN